VRSWNFGSTARLTLKAYPDLLDLMLVAKECIDAWDEFLRGKGLDGTSLSQPAAALVDALRTTREKP
jgi:hypothetical protein